MDEWLLLSWNDRKDWGGHPACNHPPFTAMPHPCSTLEIQAYTNG
jgi:hypothetical protein